MARCFLCRKTQQVGRSIRHKRGVAGKQWLKRAPKTVKIFKPNLHVTRLEKNGKKAKVKVCTKCLRRIKKRKEVIHGWKAVEVAIQKIEEKPLIVKEEKVEEKPAVVEKEVKEEKKEVKKKLVKKKTIKKAAKKPAPKKPPAKKAV